jgi:uncharacterized protein YecT (DUF1311 family)
MSTKTLSRTSSLVLALLAAALSRAHGDPVFQCGETTRTSSEAACGDRELLDLGKAVDRSLGAVVAQADPLMALLLKRDQSWFSEVLGYTGTPKFEGKSDPERIRIKDVLTHRLATLNAIKPRAIAATPAGAWANALAGVTVRQAGADTLSVTVAAKLSYADHEPVACHLTGTLKADGSGWFAGALRSPDGEAAQVRLRLQGNTLRLIARYADDHPPCGVLGIATASYFPINPAQLAAASAVAARTASPSFKCATAQNSDEEEICADPELAARDAAVARLYAEVLRRLDPGLAAQLRADQRAWVKDNPNAYDTYLHPPWNKRGYMLHETDDARAELMRRYDERLAMLANLDEKREGLTGLWVAYNGALTILPAAGKADGTVTADGRKWEVGDYKSHCEFKSDGRLEGSALRTVAKFPTLTRDGAMLVTSAEDPDGENATPPAGHPDFCWRMHSAKIRLFPVKPAAGAGVDFDRIR